MKKLALKLDSLAVETFDPAPVQGGRGTVIGEQTAIGGTCYGGTCETCVYDTCQAYCVSEIQTCPDSCFGTCDTCADTCGFTCGRTCYQTCGGATCYTCARC